MSQIATGSRRGGAIGAIRAIGRRACWIVEPLSLALLSLALNLAGNARTGLWDRDEPKYAASVREMRAAGAWVVPTFNGEPRYHKPILIYWLMGIATALGGDNPFGARLVSAISGALSVAGTWLLGRAMFGGSHGRLAALMLATAPLFVVESKLATTDATLSLFVLGCQACLLILGQRAAPIAAAGFWAFLALATLTKGPIGPALVGASSLLAWWWGWPAAAWKRLQWRRGLLGYLMVTAPWYLAISIVSRGEFLQFAVGRQIVHRLASDMEGHGGFPGFYPVVATIAVYPWSALLPVAILGAWRARRSNPGLGFLLGWAIGPLVLLECVRTKLIHYYLPALPACALLLAWLALALRADGLNIRRWPLGRLALALLVGIGLAATVLFVAAAVIAPATMCPPLILAAAVLAGGTLLGFRCLERGETPRAVFALSATWAVVLLVFSGWLIPLGEPYRTSRQVGERLAALSGRMGLEPVLLEYQEPGVIYAMGRPIARAGNRDQFFAHLAGGRSVLTVTQPGELETLSAKFGLTMTPVDRIDGFVLNKGTRQTLQFVVARQADVHEPPSTAAAIGGRGLEQTLVK